MNFDKPSEIPNALDDNDNGEEQQTSHIDEDPFCLEWIFGHNPKLRILNLTRGPDSQIIAFTSTNVCCLYNIGTKKSEYLMGHTHEINSIDHDQTGRFIVTSDKWCLNIWDRECDSCVSAELIRSIENQHHQVCLTHSAMSYDGKSIVTVDNKNNVKFWFWSFGLENADDEVHLTSKCGPIVSIRYSPNPQEYTWFLVTTENNVFFINFDVDQRKLIVHYSECGHAPKTANFTDSTYIHNDNRCISITKTGHGIIWNDYILGNPSAIVTNKKMYIKSVKLDCGPLNAVKSVDGTIAIGMECGYIKFYDYELKFLHFYQFVKFDAIQSMEFNLVERKYCLTMHKEMAKQTPRLEDGTEVWYRPLMPRDATPAKATFIIRDLIVGTKTGRIENVNFLRRMAQPVLHKSAYCINLFDLHPTKPWICLSSEESLLTIYDMESKQLISQVQLPFQQQMRSNKMVSVHPPISCLSYSRSSNHLFCGLVSGQIWLLDQVTMAPLHSRPLSFTNSQIDKMKFNETSKYLAYSDYDCYLNILVYENLEWQFMGRFRQHARLLQACIWLEQTNQEPRLITVGGDRRLVEYNMDLIYKKFQATRDPAKVLAAGICTEYILEISPIVLSAKFIPSKYFPELKTLAEYVLLATQSFNKFRIYDGNTFQLLLTVCSPYYDSPLTSIKFLDLDPNYFIVFSTLQSIGIQLIPMDGNPYRRRGMLAASAPIKAIRLSYNNQYLFTVEENEWSLKMWKINPRPILEAMQIKRPYLQPFVDLLPGGRDGWLFKEMQDYFYYIQVLYKGVNSVDEAVIDESLPLHDVIDFFRAIGFFPSEYQAEQIMSEITAKLPGERPVTHVSFRNLLKIYINHRPIAGYKVARLTRILRSFCVEESVQENHILAATQDIVDPNKIPLDSLHISKAELISLLVEKGEPMDENQALLCLKELLLPSISNLVMPNSPTEKAENIFELLPHTISLKEMVTRLLGMPMEDAHTPVFSKVTDPSEIEPKLKNKLEIDMDDA